MASSGDAGTSIIDDDGDRGFADVGADPGSDAHADARSHDE